MPLDRAHTEVVFLTHHEGNGGRDYFPSSLKVWAH